MNKITFGLLIAASVLRLHAGRVFLFCIVQGRRDLAHANTHLELESLPTGGWG